MARVMLLLNHYFEVLNLRIFSSAESISDYGFLEEKDSLNLHMMFLMYDNG